MVEMSSEERVLCVLRHGEPDRVPHFEWLVDRRVREALCPGSRTHNEFALRMSHDAILFDPIFEKERAGANRWRSEWGYVTQDTLEEHGIEVESPIKSLADFERYHPPDPHLPARFAEIETAVETFRGRKAVIVHLNDVFSLPRYLMSMQELLMAIATEPELVHALVEMSVTVNLALAREVAARGVRIVYTGDDYAYNKGPLMSPRHFREFFYPGLCRVMQGYKELGLFVIKHTDGNIWPLIDMIVDSGIDCLDPIDPQAGMDLAEVKAKFGQRVALKGNVDCARLLTFGTPEEVIEATRAALRSGMPGGGYILSSSNSIHSAVRPENYAALLHTWREYGRYPLAI
ncbi:MAG TPA: uroporphyrinogen decarboxylase family protein [Anaerolineaceae bacterium]|nr:uroporphyrinogen decarboxylase family protein [Anaerolineaceae bacterium]